MENLCRNPWIRFLILFLFFLIFGMVGCHSDRKNPIEEKESPDEEIALPDTTPPTLLTPYQSQTQMASINEAYSESRDCPWGFKHQGIDFFPNQDLAMFQTVSRGKITRVERFYNDVNKKWQVNVELRINDMYVVRYAFESMSSNPAHADTQMAHIFVQEGQIVPPGQDLGRLLVRGEYAHVDFGFFKNNVPICPEPYFTPQARDSILVVLHRKYPEASLCYE